MFEGINVHFSPVDNKPLCSYSSKLCRQRRLNGYAFCIRHILEDKNSPFKRCTFVTRNNNQICQNAIPTSQERRSYCHSHMQVAGIIPKTERKVKNPSAASSATTNNNKSDGGGGKSLKSDSNSNSSTNSSSTPIGGGGGVIIVNNNNNNKKDPNAVFKFEEEPSEIQWIPKGGRINGFVNNSNGKGNKNIPGGIGGVIKKEKNKTKSNGGLVDVVVKKSAKSNKNGKLLNQPNGTTPTDIDFVPEKGDISNSLTTTKSRQTYGKKQPTVAVQQQQQGKSSTTKLDSSLPSSKLTEECASKPTRNNVLQYCAQEHNKYFNQLRTLKCVEKSVSYLKTDHKSGPLLLSQNNGITKQPQSSNATTTSMSSFSKPTNSPSRTIQTTTTTIPVSIQQKINLKNDTSTTANKNCSSSKSKVVNNNNSSTQNNNNIDLFNNVDQSAQKVKPNPSSSSDKSMTIKSKNPLESRQEFLSRVRENFKFNLLKIKTTATDGDKQEKIFKRALRQSLLTCVVKDSSYCAHVIVQNDPKKYSDLNDNEVLVVSSNNEKKFPPSSSPPILLNNKPNKKPNSGVVNSKNTNNNNNKKNKLLVIEAAIFNNNNNNNDIMDALLTNAVGQTKSRPSKASKRNPTEKLPPQNKKKAKKSTLANLTSSSSLMDGINGLDSPSSSSLSPSSSSAHIIRSISTKKKSASSCDLLSYSNTIHNKKRKFDLLNGSEQHHHLGNSLEPSSSSFRIPKIDDSSSPSHLSDIDINGHGQMLFNNYNGHISSHHHHHHHRHQHPLLHPHSGSATTAKASNQVQLQHLLSQPDLRTLANNSISSKNHHHNQRNHGINTVLNSVGSSDMGTSDGVITDASFDSTFDHSVSSQQDCDFSDDDLEKSLEFQIDPETEHQASRLLEDNELTEDDLNELFPESNKIVRSDLSDLGVDFDIDYSLFANIFPFRSSQSESISISNQY